MKRFLGVKFLLGLLAFVLLITITLLPQLGSLSLAHAASSGGPNTFPTMAPDALYQIDETGWSGDSQTSDAVNGWGDDQWQITLSEARSVSVQVTDCCIVGDNYEVYIDSHLIGTTPVEPLYGSTLSQGKFTVVLAKGSHLITIRDPGGLAYYQQGYTFMIPAGYSVTITTAPAGFTDCPTSGTLSTIFPALHAPVTKKDKSYSLIYGPLPLTWTPTASSSTSTVCVLNSNDGGLPVYFDGSIYFQLATSHAVATLNFMGPDFSGAGIPTCNWVRGGTTNGCFLNAPGSQPAVVQWHTSGFSETFLGTPIPCGFICNTGPLTFYVDASSLFSTLSIPAILQQLELSIHTTLISHLPLIDSIASFQEPPNDVLVRDASGNLTGRLPNGQIATNIPGSLYFPASTSSGAIVLIINQPPTSYSVEVVGSPGASYTLVSSYADFLSNMSSTQAPVVTELDQQGVLGPSGVKASCFSTNTNLSCISIDIRPGNDINPINPKDNGVVEVALLSDSNIQAANINQSSLRFGANGTEASAVRCRQQDVNGDGLPDLVCDFVVSQGGFASGDFFGIVTGKTLSGQSFTGSDSIRIVGS